MRDRYTDTHTHTHTRYKNDGQADRQSAQVLATVAIM